ncbi:MAG: GspE/PulE family protein [Thermodesulfobacteriota bacterium]|nr:GspE/PulE family protein [Thermodesulfobacteriota bacterium]
MKNAALKKKEIVSIKVVERLKESLVDEGLITKDMLRTAEEAAHREGEILGRTLVRLGFITEEKILTFIGEKMQIPYVNLGNFIVDPKVLERIPLKKAHRYNVIPLFEIEGILTVAMSDPMDIISLDEITSLAGCMVEPVISSEENIKTAIEKWYGQSDAKKDIMEQLLEAFHEIEEKEESPHKYTEQLDEARLRKEAEEPPIIRLVNTIIVEAVLEKASDIHFEPKKDSMQVRFRIDGFLYPRQALPAKLIPPIISRIKIMSGLDISKRNIPQDGRIAVNMRDKNVYIRVSTLPSMYGENIVLRILDRDRKITALSDLGFSEEDLHIFSRMIEATRGIILATGPTGSGKTTTILSALTALNREEKNVMTVEDPIEYEIQGVVQSQVNFKQGFTFASALRSILRQDPDIIYVGEIRDKETVEMAVRAALTGHLVLSTLHTNDAVGAITRLRDLGVERGLIGYVLNCSFAQRLVRCNCSRCMIEYTPDSCILQSLGIFSDGPFYRGKGCEFCKNIGYKGRTGLFEILVIHENIRTLIAKNASEKEISEASRAFGMNTLIEAGREKVIKGITTVEELKRVTMDVTAPSV